MFISMHLPKCAGTSLKRAVADAYADRAVFDYGDLINDYSPQAIAQRRRRRAKLVARIKAGEFNPEIVHGHFYAPKYLGLGLSLTWLTIVRDPKDLLYSYFQYLRREERDTSIIRKAKSFDGFESFIEDGDFHNIITRMLYPLTDEDFEFIGLQEHYTKSLEEFQRILGKQNLVELRANRNPGGSGYNLSAEVARRIRTLNQSDYHLLESVKTRFHRQRFLPRKGGRRGGAKSQMREEQQQPVDPHNSAPRPGGLASKLRAIFDTKYAKMQWKGGLEDGTRSGLGSTIAATEAFRSFLPQFVAERGIKTIFDAPCGDFHWMKEVPLPSNVRYFGADVSGVLIEEVSAKFGSPDRLFLRFDIVQDPFPDMDLWICRDCLFHLPLDLGLAALKNSLRARIDHVMITSHYSVSKNSDIEIGRFRKLDLLQKPFSLPEPIHRVDEFAGTGRHRFIGVWRGEDLRKAISVA